MLLKHIIIWSFRMLGIKIIFYNYVDDCNTNKWCIFLNLLTMNEHFGQTKWCIFVNCVDICWNTCCFYLPCSGPREHNQCVPTFCTSMSKQKRYMSWSFLKAMIIWIGINDIMLLMAGHEKIRGDPCEYRLFKGGPHDRLPT